MEVPYSNTVTFLTMDCPTCAQRSLKHSAQSQKKEKEKNTGTEDRHKPTEINHADPQMTGCAERPVLLNPMISQGRGSVCVCDQRLLSN